MSIRARIIVSVTFEKVNRAPDGKARAQGNYESLQYVYRAVKEIHTITSIFCFDVNT